MFNFCLSKWFPVVWLDALKWKNTPVSRNFNYLIFSLVEHKFDNCIHYCIPTHLTIKLLIVIEVTQTAKRDCKGSI